MSDLLLKSFDIEKNPNIPEVNVGDTVTVYVRIAADKGKNSGERLQMVRGIVIRQRNAGINKSYTVRRIAANGIGVERTFLASSPRIEKIEIHRQGKVRRAQLYFMRARTGKSARLKDKTTYSAG